MILLFYNLKHGSSQALFGKKTLLFSLAACCRAADFFCTLTAACRLATINSNS
nr:MAG TPA: hypothetical protein [Bacteriophage sp.]